MNQAPDRTRELGKILVTVDTRTVDVAEPLYASAGLKIAGVIANLAWDPDVRARRATTYTFRRI